MHCVCTIKSILLYVMIIRKHTDPECICTPIIFSLVKYEGYEEKRQGVKLSKNHNIIHKLILYDKILRRLQYVGKVKYSTNEYP